MKKILLISIVLFLNNHAIADEPDFFVQFIQCKIAAGYLVLSDESLKVFDGDPSFMGCNRRSNKMSCFYEVGDDQKVNTVEYDITIDSPPLLHFSTKNGSEYIAIDTAQHAAVIITRIAQIQFLGSKVCHGTYATMFEINNMDSK